ncbi:MAG: hypothetical protein ACREL7_11170 [Longimicrobiales bacterium]
MNSHRTHAASSTSIGPWAVVATAWVAAVLLTHPVTTGDTADYVGSIASRLNGTDYNFWDFGHLLWRPIGAVLATVIRAVTGSSDLRTIALQPLVLMNIVTSLGSAFFLLATMRHLSLAGRWAIPLAIAFLLTQGVLDYGQSGTAYVPGLFFLSMGLYFAVRGATSERWLLPCVGAGVSGALAAALWLPYLFVIPALGVAAGWLGTGRGSQPLLAVALGATVTGAAVFAGIALAIGVRTPAEFLAVLSAASHGISGISGAPRAALGFGRSLLFVGDDGAIMRRYLEGDPYAPVSLARAAATRIWLIGLIWLVGALVLFQLARARQHRALLAVFAVAAIPIAIWAVAWQGGDIERYMPLYPFLFLLFAALLGMHAGARRTRIVLLVGLAFMAVNNVTGLSAIEAGSRRDAVAHRLEGLHGQVKDGDLLMVSHIQDDVLRLSNAFPLDPLVEDLAPRIGYLVQFGAPQVDTWRESFAARVQIVWEGGAQVWIASRLLEARPLPEWNWIEGSDPRVSWTDFPAFFSSFEFARSGGGDTFLLLEPTPANRSRIAALASSAPPGS